MCYVCGCPGMLCTYIVYVDNWLLTGSAIKEHFDRVATSCSGKCLKVELIEMYL